MEEKKKTEVSDPPNVTAKVELTPSALAVPAPTEEPLPPAEIPYSEADISKRYDDVYQTFTPDEVVEVTWRDGAYIFISKNGIQLRVQVIEPAIIRFRYAVAGQFGRDFSYAIDPEYLPEKTFATLNETENEYLIATSSLQVVIQRAQLRVSVYNLQDHLLYEEQEGYSATRTIMKGWSDIRLSIKCHKKEYFYGLGDKSAPINFKGKRFENWCTDSFAYNDTTDPLYRAIPFYYSLHRGNAYGIFLDNTFRTFFDFDSEEKGEVTLSAAGGEMNFYFMYGPQLTQVASAYTRLTGKPELPPIWALAYHQCRWSYYPEFRVRNIAQQFRDLDIPCDAIYLDIDYMNQYRCFTWDEKHFPDPTGMIDDLREQGFHTVVMVDPGIKEEPSYFVYDEGIKNDYFLRTTDGDIATGPVWPGFCVFPDFTHPDVRQWWGGLFRSLYLDNKISGFWIDMNEPAVFHVNHKTLPDYVMHHYDGAPCSHKKAHNIYGQQMSRATVHGLKTLQKEKRPFLLTRASYSGGQRYAAVWTGDNYAAWEHLQIANIQCVRLAVSGFSFSGTDIGGFAGECDGELYTRWLQLSVFHPLMRTHSMGSHASGDTAITEEAELLDPTKRDEQEPWSFGEKWTPIARKAIELRYCLLAALYTAFHKYTEDGTPVMRHLIFEDQTDLKLLEQERDFMFGQHIMVSPVVQPKINRQATYLPKGQWYYFWTGQSVPGGADFHINLHPQEIPFFVRAGAVLPIYPVRQSTLLEDVDELSLYVYYKIGEETSDLYEDEGEGYDYQKGNFLRQIFYTKGSKDYFSLRVERQGSFKPTYERIKIVMLGLPYFVKKCAVDGVELPIKEIRFKDRAIYTLSLKGHFDEIVWEG